MRLVFIYVLIFFLIPNAKCQTHQQADGQVKSFPFGMIDELQSRILGEKRVFNIYLPDGYNAKDTVEYPVVYLLDGSADEDFIHISGLYQFNSFDWVGRVPKSIIVGISNVDRQRDFTFPTSDEQQQKDYPKAGHSQTFIEFIKHELQPYIETKYRASHNRTIIGESLGGLLATEILLKYPTLFDQYIIVSPSIWWDNGSVLDINSELLNPSFNQKLKVFIAVGKEGLTPAIIPRVMEVDVNLLAEKLKNAQSNTVAVYLDYLPDENHATIMHQAVYNALKWLGKKPCR